eukprot:8188365-Alexandrium_andersonii.AAC.1
MASVTGWPTPTGGHVGKPAWGLYGGAACRKAPGATGSFRGHRRHVERPLDGEPAHGQGHGQKG